MIKRIVDNKRSTLGINKTDFSFLNNKVLFSFKYLQSKDNFCITKYDDLIDIKKCLERLKVINDMSISDFRMYKTELRNHAVNFSDTTEECFWIPHEDELIWDTWVFQFWISKAKWRVIWFIIQNTFYIVWFDPLHELYS